MPRPRAVFTLAGLALATGCAPTPMYETPPPRATAAAPAQSAPAVEQPLDLTTVLGAPCSSLSNDQVTEFLGEEPEQEAREDGITGSSCSWYSGMRSNAEIAVTYPRLTDEGLTAIYRNRDAYDFFEEISPVDGFPAISHGDRDKRHDGECLVTVGTSDSDYVHVHVYLGSGSVGRLGPCDAAHEVATAVVGNLKAIGASTPSAASSTSAVPSVMKPLDLTAVLGDPCTSLTPAQATGYLGDPVDIDVRTQNSSGPSCSWRSGMRSNAEIVITYPRVTDEGLTAIYRNKDAHVYFDEVPAVNGYPAVSYGGVDNRDEGECLITVGTSDHDYLNADVYLGDSSVGRVDPCEAAHAVASDVIGNIAARQ